MKSKRFRCAALITVLQLNNKQTVFWYDIKKDTHFLKEWKDNSMRKYTMILKFKAKANFGMILLSKKSIKKWILKFVVKTSINHRFIIISKKVDAPRGHLTLENR